MGHKIILDHHEDDASPGTVMLTFVELVMRLGTLAAKIAILIVLMNILVVSWILRFILEIIHIIFDIIGSVLVPLKLLRESNKEILDAKSSVENNGECIENDAKTNKETVEIINGDINRTKESNKIESMNRKFWKTKNLTLRAFSIVLTKLNTAHMEIYFCLEEVGQLPEKSEYVFERYVHNFRYYVASVVNPKWKKVQFTYKGITLASNEGFRQYLQRKKMHFGVYKSDSPYKIDYSKVSKNQLSDRPEHIGERPSKRSHIRRELSNFRPMKESSVYCINDHIDIFESNSALLKSQLDRDFIKPKINGNKVPKGKGTYSDISSSKIINE